MRPIVEQLTYKDAERVALLSDTHGYLDTRIAEVVASCDCAVHAGDIGSAEVLANLRPTSQRVVAVLGNNDVAEKWAVNDQGLLSALPVEACLSLNGGRLVVVHGHKAGSVKGRHAWLRKRYPDARLVVYGHSHRLVCDQTDLPWIVNPGGAGRARTYGGPSCMILSISGDEWSIGTFRFPPLNPVGRKRRRRAAPGG